MKHLPYLCACMAVLLMLGSCKKDNNVECAGHLLRITNGDGKTVESYEYNTAGQLTKHTYPYSGNPQQEGITQYFYAAGHIDSVVEFNPQGEINSTNIYTHDAGGLPVTKTQYVRGQLYNMDSFYYADGKLNKDVVYYGTNPSSSYRTYSYGNGIGISYGYTKDIYRGNYYRSDSVVTTYDNQRNPMYLLHDIDPTVTEHNVLGSSTFNLPAPPPPPGGFSCDCDPINDYFLAGTTYYQYNKAGLPASYSRVDDNGKLASIQYYIYDCGK